MVIDPKTYDKALKWMPGAALNVGQHAVQMAAGLGHAVTHPVEDVKGLYDVGQSIGNRGSQAAGLPYDKASAGKADAAWQHFANKYSSVDAKGNRSIDLKRIHDTLRDDPGSVMEDASMVLPGVGAAADAGRVAATGAGMARTANVLKTVGSTAKTVGEAANPLALPIAGAKAVAAAKPLSRIGAAVTELQGNRTGTGATAMRSAFNAGRNTVPGAADTFKRHITGGPSTDAEVQATANRAVDKKARRARANYVQQKGQLATGPVDYTKINQAVSDAADRVDLHPDDLNSSTFTTQKSGPGLEPAKQAVHEAKQIIDDHATSPDASKQGILGLDLMKQKLDGLFSKFGPDAHGALMQIKEAVKGTANDIDPDYDKLLGDWSDAQKTVRDAGKTVGVNGTSQASLAKQLKLLKSPAGGDLISSLAEEEPHLPFMLAGQAARPWFRGGLAGFLGGTGEGLGLAGSLALHNPVLAAGAVGDAALSSPRLQSGVNYAAGKAAGALDAAKPVTDAVGAWGAGAANVGARLSPALDRTAQAGPAATPPPVHPANLPTPADDGSYSPEEADVVSQATAPRTAPHTASAAPAAAPAQDDDSLSPEEADVLSQQSPQPHSTGGRAPFARGGKIDDGHERLVNRLMRMAEHAKKASNEVTEPLLKAPDEHIVKALAIAQKAI